MSRYVAILAFVSITVFAIAIGGFFLTNRKTSNVYVPKSITPGSAYYPIRNQTIYQHIHSISSGRANLFNEQGECKLWGGTDKVLGGNNTELGDFPCMALLEYQVGHNETSFDCAGSLISNRYVITAAHCLERSKNLVNVRLGEYDTSKNPDCAGEDDCQPEPINVGIERIIPHENYSTVNYVNDIGLIRLSKDITFVNYFIKPICIPDASFNSPTGQLVEVVGWGSNGTLAKISILQKLVIKIYNWEECRDKFAPRQIYPSQLCAGGEQDKDACNRDSGGPLVLKYNNRTYIEGIISYGLGCGTDGVPGVYTRVSYYHDWIKNNLEP